MTNCLNCNKELKKNQTKFCSRSCAAKINNKIPKRKKQSLMFECLNCNNNFERVPSRIKKGHTKYCSINCQNTFKIKTNENRNKELFENGKLNKRYSIRKILLELYGHKCSVCDLKEWQNKPIPLWVDHKDGDASNNSSSNLRLICLNCDALSTTFGGKNRGNGRRSKGLKPWD
jgi:hypothetical protein